jgi:hypothetical protein
MNCIQNVVTNLTSFGIMKVKIKMLISRNSKTDFNGNF